MVRGKCHFCTVGEGKKCHFLSSQKYLLALVYIENLSFSKFCLKLCKLVNPEKCELVL